MKALAYFNSIHVNDFVSRSSESLLNEIFDYVDNFFYDGTPSSLPYVEFYKNVGNYALLYHSHTSAENILDIYIYGSASTLRRIINRFNTLKIPFHA